MDSYYQQGAPHSLPDPRIQIKTADRVTIMVHPVISYPASNLSSNSILASEWFIFDNLGAHRPL